MPDEAPEGMELMEILAAIDNGRFMTEAVKAWRSMMAAVLETGKAGSVTLKIGVIPQSRSTVKIGGVVSAKEPEHPRETTTFFVTPKGDLFRDDPAQQKLDLKVVRMPDSGEVRRVHAAE